MSAPDRALKNLNLNEMPVTRSTTRSVGEGRGRGQPQSGPGRMNPLARPTQRGTSQYPTESSSLASQVTTEFSHQTHFPGNFVVVNVKRIGSTVDFTLIPGAIKSANQGALPLSQSMRARPSNEQASVSVQYDPVEENHQASCDRHRDASNPICFHIQWLIGRLYSVLRKIKPTTAENINQQVGQLYERMKDMSNDDLLQCVRSDDDNADLDIHLPSVRAEEQEARRTNLCDILSSFDEDETPMGFLEHVTRSSTTPASPDSFLVENELPATMFRLAMRDDHIYGVLYNLVPGDVRARKYYETQYARAAEVLESPEPVREAVRRIRKIVHDMYEDRAKRREKFSNDPQDAIDAILAEILAKLVRMVVDDRDNAEDGTQSMYVHLISNPRRGTQGMEGWMKDMFVLDRYQELWIRNQARLNYRWPAIRQRWDSIRRRVEETTTSDYDPAMLFAGKIEEIIQALNGRPSDPSVSAQRFRMPQIDQPFEDEDEPY